MKNKAAFLEMLNHGFKFSDDPPGYHTWHDRLNFVSTWYFGHGAILTPAKLLEATSQWDDRHPSNDYSTGPICGPNRLGEDELLGYLVEFATKGYIVIEGYWEARHEEGGEDAEFLAILHRDYPGHEFELGEVTQ